MRQTAIFAGAFAVTLALLLVVYLAMGGNRSSGPAAAITQSPSPTATPQRTVRPTRSPSPSPPGTASPSPLASASAEPSPTHVPLSSSEATPIPSVALGTKVTVTVRGADYAAANPQPDSTITKLSSGSVLIESTSNASEETVLLYSLPSGSLPSGAQIARLDTTVCGSGGGTGGFWEVYGPDGSDPTEYEATPPASDGCWHFERSPGVDTSVHAGVQLAATLRIDKVVYTVWLR